MKQIILIFIMFVVFCSACHQTSIGYLNTDNAVYYPDTMYIRKFPDMNLDAVRIENKAPWVSMQLQGYEGTEQIYFSVETVTSDQGEEIAQSFMKNLKIRGGGSLEFPFENDAIPGTYKISIRLTNSGYSQVLRDAMTIIVKE